jgi:hypothetical protein
MAGPGPPHTAPIADQVPFWEPIGRLVFAFGHLEAQIDWCISSLLAADSACGGPSVASQIRNLCSRIALVEALFRQRTTDTSQRAELHCLIQELRTVIKFRNGVLHGPWGARVADGRAWQKPRTHPIDLSPGSFEVTVEAIDAHIERAAEVGSALVTLMRVVAEEQAARVRDTP